MLKAAENPMANQVEYSKAGYDAKAKELAELSEREKQEEDDAEKIKILAKKIALKKELERFLESAENQAGQENVEFEAGRENGQRKREAQEQQNAERAAREKEIEFQHQAAEIARAKLIEEEAQRTAQLLEEARAKINSIKTGDLDSEKNKN